MDAFAGVVDGVRRVELNDQVDVSGDLADGIALGDACFEGHGNQAVDRAFRVFCVGGRKGTFRHLHRFEHGDDFLACHLTDDYSFEVHAHECVEDGRQVGAAFEFVCRRVSFPAAVYDLGRDDELFTAGHVVKEQFSFGFGCADSGFEGQSVRERSGECCLS
ncbi:hypothetical protein GCM10020255_007140 [Rhodococcus baikonurensis]